MLTNFFCDKKEFKIIENKDIKKYLEKKSSNIWVHIKDVSNEEVEILKENFKIHPTTIEDIFSQQTRSKYEEFEEYTLIIFKGVKEVRENSIETYNISLIIGKNFLISVNGNNNDVIDELCRNSRKIESILRKGKDYIAHYILDKEVDRYLRIKSESGEYLKQIEREFMETQSKEILKKVFSNELNFLELRQLSESATDLCLNLTKPADNYIDNNLIPYFRDVYDHLFKTTEGYKSMLGRMNGIKNMCATITSMKTNEVMRSLTVIMALMMPLTIITGFFGMNVKIPLLEHPYSYLYTLFLMVFFSAIMIIISKKKGWIGNK